MARVWDYIPISRRRSVDAARLRAGLIDTVN